MLTERPDLPSGVDAVIRTATAPDPAKRFADMGEFMLAFRSAAAGLPRGATTTEDEAGSRPIPTPEDRPRGRASRTLLAMRLEQVNPYKGLRAFGEADVGDFFGREAATVRLQDAMTSSRFVAVVGPSGSGKSSLVRAGLVPSLRARGAWVATMVPGAHPFDQAENALLRFAPSSVTSLMDQLMSDDRGLVRAIGRVLPEDSDTELVLIVDQFEELFTHTDAETRSRFASALVHVAIDDRCRARLLVTLRADFYDRPLTVPGLGELVRDHTVAMTPLDGDELERSITHPASRVGVSVEPELVAKLVADATTNPASLPLLQYSLTELYEQRTGGQMTLTAYSQLGGLAGAVAGRAEELCASVGDVEDVRRLFTRLVTPGEGTADTRRRARRSELAGVPDEVVDAFGAARLLAFDHDPATREPTVEVAHEALIRNWPRLRAWLAEDRDGLRVLRHLSDSAGAWDSRGREPGDLYRGARLAAATDLVSGSPERLTEIEAEFVAASREAADADEHRRRRSTRRLRRFAAGLSIALVCALIAGVVAVDQRRNADTAATTARARRLLSEAQVLAPENLQVALLLASEAVDLDPTINTAGLIGLIPPRLERIQTFGGQSLGFGASLARESTLPIPTEGGTLYLWDANSGKVKQTVAEDDMSFIASIAPDGRHLVTGGTHTGEVTVWDLDSGQAVARFQTGQPLAIAYAVSNDARELLVNNFGVSVRFVRFTEDGRPEVLSEVSARFGATPIVSPDGRLMAVPDLGPSGFQYTLYDVSDRRKPINVSVLPPQDLGAATRFSPDSTILAISTRVGVRLYDVTDPSTPSLLCTFDIPGAVTANMGVPALFSADGRFAAIGGGDGRLAVIAIPTCETISVSDTQPGISAPMGFLGSGDDLRVVMKGDTEIRVVDVSPSHRLATSVALLANPFEGLGPASTVQYDVAGAVFGTLNFSLLRGRELTTTPEDAPGFWTAAKRADGLEAVSVGDGESEAEVLLTLGGRELARIETGRRYGPYLWFSPDGRRLVVGLYGDDGTTRLGLPLFGDPQGFATAVLYDVTDPEHPRELARHQVDDQATFGFQYLRSIDAAASPDGSLIAIASVWSSQVIVLDAETGAVRQYLESGGALWWNGVDFVDNRTLVGAGNIGFIDTEAFWNVDTGAVVDTLSVGEDTVRAVAVNRASGVMAIGHNNGELTLFDAKTRSQLGPPINLSLGAIVDLEFREDGQRLLVAYDNGVVEWDLSREAWKKAVCDIVGRNLTEEESRLYFDGDASHTSTCPGV